MLPTGWEYDDKTEEINDIIESVNQLPIVDVLASYNVEPERHSGRFVAALCPFHMDNKIGSFMINTDKNSCWCYACNKGGGVVKAVSMILDVDFAQAALQVACDNEIITKDKYNELSKVEYKPVKKAEKTKETKSKVDYSLAEEVYLDMAKFFGLSKEHETHILKDRGLSSKGVLEMAFSMDTTKPEFYKHLYSVYDKEKRAEIAEKVPGFFLKKDRFGNFDLDVVPKKGLALLLTDTFGDIRAIQVRDDDPDANIRYTFFSYVPPKKFNDFLRGGASCGTPACIHFEKNVSTGNIAICEGFFKGAKLAENEFNTISLPGVNNFKGIEKEIKVLRKELRDGYEVKPSNTISIFYDADFIKNPQVTAAAIKLGEYIMKKMPEITVNYIVWNPDNGKGIDDLINNGKRSTCKKYDFDYYSSTSQKAFTDALFVTGFTDTPQTKLTKNDRTIILSEFERIMRNKFNM